MKIPKIEKLPSGNYFCRLRLNGQSIPITEASEALCAAQAMAYKSGMLQNKKASTATKTLYRAIDEYIADRRNVLSPATIRGYRTIQRNRFKSVMDKPIGNIRNWQKVIDMEAAICSPKTVINSWGLVRSAICDDVSLPRVRLPQKIPQQPKFLRPEQIPAFVEAVYSSSTYAVPALLALSSLRLSEIKALRWENIPEDAELIRVEGAIVPNEYHEYIEKKQNKTRRSTRSVPIYIPALKAAMERDRQPSGYVMQCSESALRLFIKRICRELGFDEVSIHGLRHSFASLAYSLNVPEKILMEIGGWENEATVHNIYIHIAESDVAHYESAIKAFYQNANENANEK